MDANITAIQKDTDIWMQISLQLKQQVTRHECIDN